MTPIPKMLYIQGNIEISLKPPKTHILYKKREFPQSEPKSNPHATKKKSSLNLQKNYFYRGTVKPLLIIHHLLS